MFAHRPVAAGQCKLELTMFWGSKNHIGWVCFSSKMSFLICAGGLNSHSFGWGMVMRPHRGLYANYIEGFPKVAWDDQLGFGWAHLCKNPLEGEGYQVIRHWTASDIAPMGR